LPRDPREESRPEPTVPPRAAAPGGDLTVLVVDDEIALRNALLRFLARRGIRGEGVSDGAEALRVLQQRNFDVIISDVRMPGRSRIRASRITRSQPTLRGESALAHASARAIRPIRRATGISGAVPRPATINTGPPGPRVIRSPSRRGTAVVTRSSFRKVPCLDPASRTASPPAGLTVSSAWMRDTTVSGASTGWTSHS